MNTRLIAITGGIGAGKSVVSRVLRCMGYNVIDSDSLAREFMDNDNSIKEALNTLIAHDIVVNGVINRQRLASIVFSDADKLATLNAIVHTSVRDALAIFVQNSSCSVLFVETAILYQSHLNRQVDAEWNVDAPEDIRIARVIRRNGISVEQVKARIDSQRFTPANGEPIPPVYTITNDDSTPILPQILKALNFKSV